MHATSSLLKLLIPAACIACPLPGQAAEVETPTEIHLAADLTGDGRQDIVVIDRASGAFRTAYQANPEIWSWAAARATGLTNITGATVGSWFTTSRQSFAVAAPMANRSHIVQAPAPLSQPTLTPVFGQGIGPHALAAPDIAGPGNTPESDLWIASRENAGGSPFQMDSIRHDGSEFTLIAPAQTQGLASSVRTIPLKSGTSPVVAYLGLSPNSDSRLTILSYAVSPPSEIIHRFLPEASEWTSGALGNAPLHHLLTWLPGETEFLSHPITEGPPNTFNLAAQVSYSVALPIGRLAIAQSDQGPRLIVISPDASSAEVYDFDGNSSPEFLQQIAPTPGDELTGLLPLANGGFQMLSGPSGSGTSSSMTHYFPENGLFSPGLTTQLPDFRPAALRANTFAFSGEPFVDPAATLLARYNVPEWSSTPLLNGNELTISREIYGGNSVGLGTKSQFILGTVPVGTTFGLTNQYSDVISVHSFDAGSHEIGADAEISPPAGIQTQAFRVDFNPSPENAGIRFQINGGPWQAWSQQEILIHQDTTIRYYALDPNSQHPSAIRIAEYTFEIPPHLMDSDGDGIPDFVEIHLGLDPLGGLDHDGDGYSDLEEILAGTKPDDDSDFPDPEGPRPDQGLAFQLRAAPSPLDGATLTRRFTQADNLIRANALDGTLLASRPAAALGVPGIFGPGLRADQLVADERLALVSVSTEPVFTINTTDPDKERGREVARLFHIPATTTPTILYTPGGGTPEDEANSWIAAAQTAYTSLERPIVSGTFQEIDTLAALLLEYKIEQILVAREAEGIDPGKLTLFGGRTGDAARIAPTAHQLASLRLQISEFLPGYDIGALFSAIESAVKSAPALADARAVATAIYRVSSASANAAPPGTYLPPFDVLRAYVRGTPLPQPYKAEVGIASKAINDGQAAISALLASLEGRPVNSFTLTVDANSFSGGCLTLIDPITTDTVTLFAAPGIPYQSIDNFTLLPGTVILATGYTDITSSCPGQALEVISISILSFPEPPLNDSNANLLPDDWEWLFLLNLDNDPWGDDDNDGIVNLQEYLDGTDPLDPYSKADQPLLLAAPQLYVIKNEDGEGITLWWHFPQAYIDQIDWSLITSNDLENWAPNPAPIINPEPGWLTIELPNAILDTPQQFYRITLALK